MTASEYEYDIYDLNSPRLVMPNAPTQAAPRTATVKQSKHERLSAKDLLTWLGLLSLVPLLIGEIYYTEIVFEGATDIVTLACLLVVAVGNIATGVFILFAMFAGRNDAKQVTA